MQVRTFVSKLDDGGVVSAKTLYEELDHPALHDLKSSVGKINQALHAHWCNGDLIAYSDPNGTLLREEEFVAPGSAAVEHPQIFAKPGTPTPRAGYDAVTYAEYHRAGTLGHTHAPGLGDDKLIELARRVDEIVDKHASFPEWAERDDVLRDIRKDTIKLLLADDETKPLVSGGFIDEVLQVATAREGAAA